jgi:DNA-binding transcriptional regulator GbsR (MarR family)
MTPEHIELNPVVRRFIEEAGNMTQSLGIGRVLGQIYAYLYFSPEPKNLADMQKALGISKGSASTMVRQLEQWHAVKKVWIKGDRKDYYQAEDWVGKVVRNILADTVGKKLIASNGMLEGVDAELAELDANDEHREFIKQRVEHIRQFQKKAQTLWNNPLVQRLLK